MSTLLKKSLNFNRKIKINFDGEDLTSDAGLLLYKEFDEKTVNYIFKYGSDIEKYILNYTCDILTARLVFSK